MRKQQKVWQEEHNKSKAIPSLATEEPSSAVVDFVKFLKDKQINSGKVVDIGCGKGRNAIYLVKLGFEVYGMDYIRLALDHTRELAIKNGVADLIHLYNRSLDEQWLFENNFFDIAIDCFSSIDIEDYQGRKVCKDEMFRTLKPGGYGMVTAVSVEDEIEKELIKTNPGSEKNSTIWPNGKFQKDYDEKELRDFYSDFKTIELKEIKKKAVKLGREYLATNFWVVLRKPLD